MKLITQSLTNLETLAFHIANLTGCKTGGFSSDDFAKERWNLTQSISGWAYELSTLAANACLILVYGNDERSLYALSIGNELSIPTFKLDDFTNDLAANFDHELSKTNKNILFVSENATELTMAFQVFQKLTKILSIMNKVDPMLANRRDQIIAALLSQPNEIINIMNAKQYIHDLDLNSFGLNLEM